MGWGYARSVRKLDNVFPSALTPHGFYETTDTACHDLRLRVGPHVRAGVISSTPISVDAAKRNEGEIWLLRALPSPLMRQIESVSDLGENDFSWLRGNWPKAAKLRVQV